MSKNREIAKRYAKAFIASFPEEKKLQEASEQLILTIEAICTSDFYKKFKGTFFFKKRVRDLLLDIVAEKQFSSHLGNFFKLLSESNRLDCLHFIKEALQAKLQEKENRYPVDFVSAVELSQEEQGRLQKDIQTMLGFDPILNITINSDLISGYIMTYNAIRLDTSFKTKCERLNKTMKGLD